MDFSSVTISFFVHSTEDENRLLKLVQDRLGLENDEISKENITGYFGNTIISVKGHIIGNRAEETALRILYLISKVARNTLREDIEISLDEHDSLYFRLDRQTLGEARLSLSEEEPVRIKLKPKKRSGGREFMKSEYEELLK